MKREVLNPKHEIRNPKQYRMTEIQMFQKEDMPGSSFLRFLSLNHLIFEFVSGFDIRISARQDKPGAAC
jgi:hypothetical protein